MTSIYASLTCGMIWGDPCLGFQGLMRHATETGPGGVYASEAQFSNEETARVRQRRMISVSLAHTLDCHVC